MLPYVGFIVDNQSLLGRVLASPNLVMRMGHLCVHINLHKCVLHGHTTNTLTYLFQQHAHTANIIPHRCGLLSENEQLGMA